eukprot:COSAG02_NODE_2395_length_8958_cov_167.540354_4_plen_111_part_00
MVTAALVILVLVLVLVPVPQTLGNTRIRLLAAGVPEHDWGPPLDYITNVYHLAPNTVLLCGGGGGFTMSQHWPAGSVDSCTAELSQWCVSQLLYSKYAMYKQVEPSCRCN